MNIHIDEFRELPRAAAMDHAAAIRSHISELESEIRNDPRVAVVRHLKAALSVLEGVTGTSDMIGHQLPQARYEQAYPAPTEPRAESKIKRIQALAGAYIDRHGPTHRSVLVEALVNAGLMEGVKEPLRAFATSMNTLKDHFVSDGKGTFRRRIADSNVPSVLDARDNTPVVPQDSPHGESGGMAPPETIPSTIGQSVQAVYPAGKAGGI